MDGFININKEPGISSHGVVAAVRRLLHCKAGHCGTLDPAAGGVLPVCIGKATRLAEYISGGVKRYRGTVVFGIETDSYDAMGAEVGRASAAHLNRQDIEALLPQFIGEIDQIPPVVSALKSGGVPLYKRFRRGEDIEVAARKVRIYDIELKNFRPGVETAEAEIEVECGQGTYIRSIAHDLGQLCGCGAHLAHLQRLQVGDFRIETALTLERLAEIIAAGEDDWLLPMQYPLANWPRFVVTDQQLRQVLHGNPLCLGPETEPVELCLVENSDGVLLGIANILNNDTKEGAVLNMTKVLADPPAAKKYDAVVIGNFDGVHLGHRALFSELYRIKQQTGAVTAAVTFDPHPMALIKGKMPPLLNAAEAKIALIKKYFAVDEVVVLPFDQQLMNSTPQQFVDRIICCVLKASQVIVGYNFSFGAGGQGNAQMLKELCEPRGIKVMIIDQVTSPYGDISSSNIRERLSRGDMEAANYMLGYWYTLAGEVVRGKSIGRTLGFPTANFYPATDRVYIPCGVYAVRVEHNRITYDGVANYGYKPTVGNFLQPSIEVHIFNQDITLYGENIKVCFGEFIRPEHKFDNLDQLREEIGRNKETAKDFLITQNADKHLPKPIK